MKEWLVVALLLVVVFALPFVAQSSGQEPEQKATTIGTWTKNVDGTYTAVQGILTVEIQKKEDLEAIISVCDKMTVERTKLLSDVENGKLNYDLNLVIAARQKIMDLDCRQVGDQMKKDLKEVNDFETAIAALANK